MNTTYRIVYYQGRANTLCVAQVTEGEERDYTMASKKVFPGTQEGREQAEELCRDLALRHKKETSGLPLPFLE